jgi:hypothetical protein
MQTFTLYTDPGHGWLEVPRELLHELGIADEISQFSYQRMERVFLEEDCDLATFTRAMGAAGREFKVLEVNEPRNDSFVRSLPSYRAEVRS